LLASRPLDKAETVKTFL